MKQTLRLAALLAAGPLVAAGPLPASAAAAPTTIKFTAIQYHATQKGKVVSFQEHLISAGRTIGHDSISCTEVGHSLHCTGTFFFTSGVLHVKATVGSGNVNHGTVTSGTGRYAGRTGTFTLTDITSTRTTIVVSLR
ncbi:MAG TPA: hypothetical protein VG165_04985 [Solirubrobacteraceae bacterium]|jgi:hypothetical protein|nr:hypothetical protein [Solirubrobacteraceae bacterium]